MPWDWFKKGSRKTKKIVGDVTFGYVDIKGKKQVIPEFISLEQALKDENKNKNKNERSKKSSTLKRRDAFYESPKPKTKISSEGKYTIFEDYIPSYTEIVGIKTTNTPDGTVSLGLKKRSKTRKNQKKHKTQKRHKKSKKGFNKSKTYKRKYH